MLCKAHGEGEREACSPHLYTALCPAPVPRGCHAPHAAIPSSHTHLGFCLILPSSGSFSVFTPMRRYPGPIQAFFRHGPVGAALAVNASAGDKQHRQADSRHAAATLASRTTHAHAHADQPRAPHKNARTHAGRRTAQSLAFTRALLFFHSVGLGVRRKEKRVVRGSSHVVMEPHATKAAFDTTTLTND